MAVALQVSGIQPFDTHGDANSLCMRWERWLRSIKLYVGASGVVDDKQKRQLLLHSAGMDVQDIFYTLTDTGDDYQTARNKLTTYFTPHKHTSFNRHVSERKCRRNGRA